MTDTEKPSKPKTEAVKTEAPTATPAATTPAKKDNTKTILIVVGVVVVIFVVIPAILFTVLAGVVGHKIADGGIKVSNDGQSATIKTKNGDEISTGGNSQTLPKDWPASVTTYKGTIVNSSRLTIEGKVTYSVVIETKDDPAMVASMLSQAFSTNGWVANLDNKTNDGGLIAADNAAAGLHVQVLYTTKDGKTTISYTVVPKTAE